MDPLKFLETTLHSRKTGVFATGISLKYNFKRIFQQDKAYKKAQTSSVYFLYNDKKK